MTQHHTPLPTPPRRPLRAVAVGAAATALVLLPVTTASAHVRVIADQTTEGGYAQLTFRVPTESETAGTSALRVELPTGTPFTSVRARPVPGWTAEVERADLPAPVEVAGTSITEAPRAVVWTADPGAEVEPGQYQEFAISVGPLPAAGTELLLPAAQTYTDGEVVTWDEPAPAGGAEPEHPAPALTTIAVAEGAHGGEAATGGPALTGTAPTSEELALAGTSGGGPDILGRWLGGGGLVLGAAGLLVTVLTRRASRGDSL